MGCVRAVRCPLFPYLNSSLRGWRETYCDSVDGWQDCARFQLASTGQTPPLNLLPNGQMPVAMLPDWIPAYEQRLFGPQGYPQQAYPQQSDPQQSTENWLHAPSHPVYQEPRPAGSGHRVPPQPAPGFAPVQRRWWRRMWRWLQAHE